MYFCAILTGREEKTNKLMLRLSSLLRRTEARSACGVRGGGGRPFPCVHGLGLR